MDVNREWQRFNREEYVCGNYAVYRPLGDKGWEIYWDNPGWPGSREILVEGIPTLGKAKEWIKANWRRHLAEAR